MASAYMTQIPPGSREVERLKPLEVFLDIPCAVCGKPMANTWKREQEERIFKACGMAHPECWETPFGRVMHKETYLRLLNSHEALSSYGKNQQNNTALCYRKLEA
ncbi:MAG: hypothetical protein ABIG98_04645 [Chloroflexota bacterium]